MLCERGREVGAIFVSLFLGSSYTHLHAKASRFMRDSRHSLCFLFINKSEKVAAHSGVTRHHDSNSATTSTSNPGRVIANRVFVGNIPSNLVERDLLMLFNRFGKIRDVKIIPEHTRNKSYGFVTFFSEADARRAIQVANHVLLAHDVI